MSDLSAKLVYGYEIGITGSWKLLEAQLDESNQRPTLVTNWYDDIANYPNFVQLMWDQLYSAIPSIPPNENPSERESIARSFYNVTLECAGAEGQLNQVLVVTDLRYETEWSNTLTVNPGALQSRPLSGRYNEKLRKALNALSITPLQPHAQWILAGVYL